METTSQLEIPREEKSQRSRMALVERLASTPMFREYQRSFESVMGLPLTLRVAGSFRPPLEGRRKASPFCVLMATRSRSCAACLNAQSRLEIAARDRTATLKCHAGLCESAIPLRVGNDTVAYLQTGQVRFRAPSGREVSRVVDEMAHLDDNLDRARAATVYRQTRVIDREQYTAMLRILCSFAGQLAVMSNQLILQHTVQESPAITKARSYIAGHYSDELTLSQVARAAGMSPFYFCKVFKRVTGFTFTDYLSRVRVESVKHLLGNPNTRISEAAYAAGFQSLSHFNRVFNRIAGQPPSAYREQTARIDPAAADPAGGSVNAA